MDELIGRLVANVGIDRAAAEKAVGIILDFLAKEGRPTRCNALLAKLPGAESRGRSRQRAAVHGRRDGRGNAHDGRAAEHGASAERHPAIHRLRT